MPEPITVFDFITGTTRQVESVEAYLQQAANDALREVARLREALEKIAGQDFRGNRSTESQIAYSALHGCPHPLHLDDVATKPCPNCMGWIPKA